MTLKRRHLVALHGFGHYAWRYQVAPLLKVIALLRRVWTLGGAERTALTGAVALSVAAALTLVPGAPASAAAITRSGAHLGLFVLIWSVALAAAASQRGPFALAILAPWLVFYQVLVSGTWVGTPVVVLPILWIAWIFYLSARSLPSTVAASAWWCLAAVCVGYVTAGPSGLRRGLGWNLLPAQVLVGGVMSVAGLAALYITRARARSRVEFGLTLWGALLVSGAVVASGAAKDWVFTVDWAEQMIGDAGAIVVLFWMWIGGRAGAGSLHFAEWSVRQSARVLPTSVLIAGTPPVVAAVAMLEWWTLRSAAPAGSELHTIALAGHMVAAAIMLAWLATLWLRRRMTHAHVLSALTWWALAWLVLQGLRAAGDAVVATRESAHALAVVTLLALVIGLIAEFGELERSWAKLSDERVRRQLGFVVAAVGCAVVLMTTPGGQWQEARSLMVLTGLVHLALPVALYERLRPRRADGPVPGPARVVLFAAGYAAALVVMAVDPAHAVSLVATLPVLLVGLVVLRRARPEVGAAGGAFAGALFGGGAVAGWMMPYPPTLPFVHVTAWTNMLRGWGQLGRPPLTWFHAALITSAWVIGGGVGWLLFRAPRASRERVPR